MGFAINISNVQKRHPPNMKTGNIDILSNLSITYTIFNYNTISLRCSFLPVPVKGLYQTASCSLHVMQLVRIKSHKDISLFHMLGRGEGNVL
jgi:hypothetical protein